MSICLFLLIKQHQIKHNVTFICFEQLRVIKIQCNINLTKINLIFLKQLPHKIMLSTLSFIFGIILTYFYALRIHQDTTIAIIGTNDLHGTALPLQLIRKDTNETYNYGGLVYLARLIEIIQNQYPQAVLYFDSGDQFQGGLQSSPKISSGQIMNDFYNSISLNGSTLGNHQFDFGPQYLKKYLDGRTSPLLLANLRNQKRQQTFLPNQQLSKIYHLKNDIKIGVIGVLTKQAKLTSNGFIKNLFPNYTIQNYAQIVIRESKKLKQQGANAIFLVAHMGNNCQFSLQYGIWIQNNNSQPLCPPDQLTQLIDLLPNKTIDGVLQGHRHKIVHQFYKGVPYMGSINGGYYFNVMYMTFDHDKKLKNIKIEGPIPVCQKVFENNNRCNYIENEQQLKTSGKLVNWKFHNKPVYAHPKVQKIFNQHWMDKLKPYLVNVVINQQYFTRQNYQESKLANLITNIMHQIQPSADFALINPGIFRSIWSPGILQLRHIYTMLPFDNKLDTFSISGKQLLNVLKTIQQGDKGFYQFWGIQQQVTIDSNFTKKFIRANFMNGSQIDPNKQYTGVTVQFLLQGGDDFTKVLQKKIYTPRNVKNIGNFQELLINKLKQMKIIQKNTLLNNNNPRLIVQNI